MYLSCVSSYHPLHSPQGKPCDDRVIAHSLLCSEAKNRAGHVQEVSTSFLACRLRRNSTWGWVEHR